MKRLIDANALKKELTGWETDPTDEEIELTIDKAPTADAVPVVHGKWIMHISEIYPADSTMECNICHAEQNLLCDDNYCPNCGAKMDGERREE